MSCDCHHDFVMKAIGRVCLNFWFGENLFGCLQIMEKPQKAKVKKKPKLSEEEKREKVREALLKKKAYESRALAIVEQLLEPNIKGNF